MAAEKGLEAALAELFEGRKVSGFCRDWLLNETNATEESVRKNYRFLQSIGVGKDKIAVHAYLLGKEPEVLEKNYEYLSSFGINGRILASCASLFGRNPETIENNYKRLSELGMSYAGIASCAYLLGRNPETIDKNYSALSCLGLEDKKIASLPSLLARDPASVKKNFQHHVSLLRGSDGERSPGRDLLRKNPRLLATSRETFEANVQFLYSRGIDYHNSFLLGTTPGNKRKKMTWMLREVFGYRHLPEDEKRNAIYGMYKLISSEPRMLKKSINTMENEKDKLKTKALEYMYCI